MIQITTNNKSIGAIKIYFNSKTVIKISNGSTQNIIPMKVCNNAMGSLEYNKDIKRLKTRKLVYLISTSKNNNNNN